MKLKIKDYPVLPIALALIALLNAGFIINAGCAKKAEAKESLQTEVQSEELIFQSGFENDCQVVKAGNDDDIIGKDLTISIKNDWKKDMDTAIGNFNIQYTGGDSTKRYAKIIPEPGKAANKVLQFWIGDYWAASENTPKARIQGNIYGIKQGFKELYQSVRMFVHNDFKELQYYPNKIDWLTISEFWNNEWWSNPNNNHGFRISLGIGKPTADASKLNFTLGAENENFQRVWTADNTSIKVPIGKWFTMEYYFKEGDSANGRFYMAITPDGESKKVVFDVHNYTHNTTDPNPDGLTEYNPMKLYTSKEIVSYMKTNGKTLQVYWDDFKLWKDKRP